MSRKTEFASSWWAQRWIRVLERFGWSARLNRGRSYARHGNVLDLDIQSGLVRAKVQGSRKQPYRVEIGMKPINRGDWNRVIALLRRKAIYAARLLSGEMPRDIEEIFKAADVPLFPQSGGDLIMSCTCPDWASPCKHVAAAYYVLGSEFDRDPFLLFELRGRTKEQVLASLRGQRPERTPSARAPRVTSEPLEEHLSDFWEAGDELDDITIRVTPPPVPQAILKRLGPIPLRDLPDEWNSDIARMYEVVSKDALAFVNLSGAVPRAPAMTPRINAGATENGHDAEETQYRILQDHVSDGESGETDSLDSDPEPDAQTLPESRAITPLEVHTGAYSNGQPDPSAIELLPDRPVLASVEAEDLTGAETQTQSRGRRRNRWPRRRDRAEAEAHSTSEQSDRPSDTTPPATVGRPSNGPPPTPPAQQSLPERLSEPYPQHPPTVPGAVESTSAALSAIDLSSTPPSGVSGPAPEPEEAPRRRTRRPSQKKTESEPIEFPTATRPDTELRPNVGTGSAASAAGVSQLDSRANHGNAGPEEALDSPPETPLMATEDESRPKRVEDNPVARPGARRSPRKKAGNDSPEATAELPSDHTTDVPAGTAGEND